MLGSLHINGRVKDKLACQYFHDTQSDCSNSCMITQMLLPRSANKVYDPEQMHFATQIENRKDDSHKQPACAHRDSWNIKLLHSPCAVPLIVEPFLRITDLKLTSLSTSKPQSPI